MSTTGLCWSFKVAGRDGGMDGLYRSVGGHWLREVVVRPVDERRWDELIRVLHSLPFHSPLGRSLRQQCHFLTRAAKGVYVNSHEGQPHDGYVDTEDGEHRSVTVRTHLRCLLCSRQECADRYNVRDTQS